MICRVSLVALMIHYSTMVYAANEKVADTSDVDFIEFLGNWETADGEWVDPNELATDDADEDRSVTTQDPQPAHGVRPAGEPKQ